MSPNKCSGIKIVCIDVDGCLSDGVYQISESGEVTKSFYTRDFYAIEQLLRNDITVFIITQSHDEVIESQVQRIASHSKFWRGCLRFGQLQIKTAIDDKKGVIQAEILTKNEWEWENIAYIGDAGNDLGCMLLAGLSGCPSDAIPLVKDKAMFVSNYMGGKGAVYEFCEYILDGKDE